MAPTLVSFETKSILEDIEDFQNEMFGKGIRACYEFEFPRVSQ